EADDSSKGVPARERPGNLGADRPAIPAKYTRRSNIGAHHVLRTIERKARYERKRGIAVQGVDKIAKVDIELRHRLYHFPERGESHRRRPYWALRSIVRHHQQSSESRSRKECFLSDGRRQRGRRRRFSLEFTMADGGRGKDGNHRGGREHN